MEHYLDYNGSTPVHPEVARAYMLALEEDFGNSAAGHPAGRAAARRIEAAKETIARALGAEPDEILLTSGGTESNNLALSGAARAARSGRGHHRRRVVRRGERIGESRPHVVVSSIEHWSVRRTAEWMGQHGFDVTLLPVGPEGIVAPADVESALRPETALVSVMWANNETGVLQPVARIGEICHHHGIPFHTDAVAALGKVPLRVDQAPVDLLSLSSHKMYAPKACGVLYIRRGTAVEPMIHGCGQQGGLRSGTENTPGAAAFAKAFELLEAGGLPDPERLASLRDRLEAGVFEAVPGVERNGSGPRLSNTSSLAFDGAPAFLLMEELGARGFSVSAGAASSKSRPSHVLMAMGFTEDRARSSLRMTLGSTTDEATVDAVVAALGEIVPRVRQAREAGHEHATETPAATAGESEVRP